MGQNIISLYSSFNMPVIRDSKFGYKGQFVGDRKSML